MALCPRGGYTFRIKAGSAAGVRPHGTRRDRLRRSLRTTPTPCIPTEETPTARIWHTLITTLRGNLARRSTYLVDAKADVRETNLSVACVSSVIAFLLLLAFLATSPLFIEGWTPSPFHYASVPLIVLTMVILTAYRVKSGSHRYGTVLSVAFMCVLFAFVTAIDTLSTPATPSVFIPSLLVAVPALIILPLRISYLITIGFAALNAAFVIAFKDPYIAQYDLLQTVVAVCFSLCVTYLVMSYRVQAYEARRHFQDLSMHDALSGILNKRTLVEAVERSIARTNPATSCTLIICDLDDFKTINDAYGHAAGDRMLQGMGDLLGKHFRATDIIGRFGGDEFVVYLEGPMAPHTLREKLCSIIEHVSRLGRDELAVYSSCSIGAVIATNEHVVFSELFAQADKALYQSKRAGKGRCTVLEHQQADPTGPLRPIGGEGESHLPDQ